MEATKVLMDEHRVITRLLNTLEVGALSLEAGSPIRAGFFLDAADFLRGFADGCHQGKEERVLFPALEAAGVPKASGPVTTMLADHREARRVVAEMRAAAEKLAAGDPSAAATVASSVHEYVDLMQQHIMKEDEVLFPVTDRLLPPDQQAKLVERFGQVENEQIDPGGHDRFLALVDSLALEVTGMTPAARLRPSTARETKQTADVDGILRKRAANRERLEREAPDLYQGFNELLKRYYKPGALERKHKELMAVTASVATRCIPCLANHATNAVAAGATREEILEAAAIGVEFGGGPSFVVVRDNLLDFLDEIEAGRAQESAG